MIDLLPENWTDQNEIKYREHLAWSKRKKRLPNTRQQFKDMQGYVDSINDYQYLKKWNKIFGK